MKILDVKICRRR